MIPLENYTCSGAYQNNLASGAESLKIHSSARLRRQLLRQRTESRDLYLRRHIVSDFFV
jgi:hypothetical protein